MCGSPRRQLFDHFWGLGNGLVPDAFAKPERLV